MTSPVPRPGGRDRSRSGPRVRGQPLWRRQQPWLLPILALLAVIHGGALSYRLIEHWDWGDCYWMVLITLSTLGFSDPHTPILHGGGRVVTALLIVGGLAVVQLTIQSLLELTNSGYFRRLRDRRYRRQLNRMHNHVILCGYGRIGREIAEQLSAEAIETLVVEMDQERSGEAIQRGLK
ncbi:MAG: ion channel, partial [Cyanobacteriota bacterium]